MTYDEETVERVVRAIHKQRAICDWEIVGDDRKEDYRNMARAALSALPPQQVSVADAARVLLDEWVNHGEGPMGELYRYSPSGDMDFFQMDADIDGEWCRFGDVEVALRALRGEAP